MKPLVQKLLVAVVLIAAASGGWLWYRQMAANLHKVAYVTRPVSRDDVAETVSCTGVIQPIRTVQVGSQVSGIIRKLYVDYNSVVKKGELMAEVDPRPLLEQQKQADFDLQSSRSNLSSQQASLRAAVENQANSVASLATARTGIDTAQVGVANAQAQLDASRAALKKAQAQLAVDQLTYNRNQTLRQKDLIAQSDLDTSKATWLEDQAGVDSAVSNVKAAEANVRSADVALVSARTQVTQAETKVSAAQAQTQAAEDSVSGAEAQVGKSESQLREANVQVEYTRILAPTDGIVIARSVDAGQTIASALSAPTLFTLGTNLKQMQIDASVDESDMARVFVGQDASFTVDAYPDQEFDATVYQVRNSPSTNNNVVTYDVMLHVKNDKLLLKPGMTANLDLIVHEDDDVLRVPNIALRFRPESAAGTHRHAGTWPGGGPGGDTHPHQEGAGQGQGQGHHRTRGRVYVLQNGVPVERDIKIGISDGTFTEVKEGLKEGESVIVGTQGPASTGGGSNPNRFGPGGGRRGGGGRIF